MNEIEIDYSRRSVTDVNAAYVMSTTEPEAHRIAQDVVVAAKKVIRKEGLFSTEKSRVANLIEALRKLHLALDKSALLNLNNYSGKTRMFVFFNMFAGAYPNWQAEYALLNLVIPNLFEDETEHQTARPAQTNTSAESHTGTKPASTHASSAKVVILCPKCHSRMRIPIGVRIRVTCRDCGNQFMQQVQRPE